MLSHARVPELTQEAYVLSDVYGKVENLGETGDRKIGMPLLYYRADPAARLFDPGEHRSGSKSPVEPRKETNNGYFYNFTDNMEMLELGMPWEIESRHDLLDNYYEFIKNDWMPTGAGISRPLRRDSYILISAGWDGEYGTHDDITNFQ